MPRSSFTIEQILTMLEKRRRASPRLPPDNARRATFVEDLNRALKLVSGHFGSARIIDHLGNNVGDIESFTTLAYLAALHPQLKFGHTVLCQSFRDPATVRRSWVGGCICMSTQAEAERIAGTRYNTNEEDDFDFVGTSQQIIEQMKPFIDLCVTSFIVDCGGFPDLTTLELLINEVLPALNNCYEPKRNK